MNETAAATRVYQRLALLLGFAVLAASRLPAVWPHGRLWAEEGAVYLAQSWAAPWYVALFTVHTGYLNLPASFAATLAADLMPLEHVPQVTVLLALMLQLVPATILLTSGIAWLRGWRVLGAALLWLAVVPMASEVWLNSITSQFHVTLAVAILLAAPVNHGPARWLHRGVLLLAPLCGPVAGTLFPLFVLRAWLERSAGRGWQAGLMVPGLLIQAAVMLTHPEPAREVAALDLPIVLAAITGKHILLPLFGPAAAERLMQGVAAVFAAGRWPVAAVLAPVLWFSAGGLAVWHGRDAATRWLLAGGMLVMAISYAGALTPAGTMELLIVGFGQRYTFVPEVLFGLAALGIAVRGRRPERLPAGLLMAWLLMAGVWFYRPPQVPMAQGPAWRPEVAAWRADPTHPLAIWPPGWAIKLEPRRP